MYILRKRVLRAIVLVIPVLAIVPGIVLVYLGQPVYVSRPESLNYDIFGALCFSDPLPGDVRHDRCRAWGDEVVISYTVDSQLIRRRVKVRPGETYVGLY